MKTLIISLGILAAANNGYALPGLDLAQRGLERKIARNARPQHQANSCTDFSGAWKGRCQYEETTVESDVTIQQTGCDSIQSGSEGPQPLGGLTTQAQTAAKYSYGLSYSSNWNASQTEILTHLNGLFKAGDQVVPLSGTLTMKIEEGKLHSDVQFPGFNVACVYEKS